MMTSFPTKTKSAFTLLEAVLTISITMVILLATATFLMTVLQSRIKNQTIAEVEQHGIQVIQFITQSLRNADKINSPAEGTSAASLSLDTMTPANNPTIFDLSNGIIRIKEGTANTIDLTSSRVTSSALTFQNLSRSETPGSIMIQFTLTHANPEGRNEYAYTKTFRTSVSLR